MMKFEVRPVWHRGNDAMRFTGLFAAALGAMLIAAPGAAQQQTRRW